MLDVAKDFTALLIIAEFDDILATLVDTYASQNEPSFDAMEYEEMMKIETTTSKKADLTSNTKLEKDLIIESINRRRALAKMGRDGLDIELIAG